jgi:tRNA-2-methylthio-N6-dimethylallyladenosine synthase
MRKIHLKSFGCQMNKLDSSLVVSALTDQGYALTDKATEADVMVINTCSVREHAEERVFSHLGHIKHLKKEASCPAGGSHRMHGPATGG